MCQSGFRGSKRNRQTSPIAMYTLTEIDRHSRRDTRAFIQLPYDIYRDIPQWVPPLLPGERARFKDSFPFYGYGEAAFLLVRDEAGRAVGRLAVLKHDSWNAYHDTRDALLYLYEAIDDDEVARLLFDHAAAWAEERGLNQLVGPKGFMAADGLGLLVEGFEHRPAIGIPYNPAYYVHHWADVAGMEKVVDYLSGYIDRDSFEYPDKVRRVAAKIRERRDFRVPSFRNKREIRAYAPAIQEAYNTAFNGLWSYTPLPDDQLRAVVNRLIFIADPPLMKLIFQREELIGFQFAFPDISAAFQRSKGRLLPFGWLDILLEKGRTEWLNINGNAILPAYQGTGANAVLYDEMLRTLVDSVQYQYGDLTQVQETNLKMLADLEAVVPINIYKRHRVYCKKIG